MRTQQIVYKFFHKTSQYLITASQVFAIGMLISVGMATSVAASTYIVSSEADAGAGTLRDAIIAANANSQ